MIPIFPTKNTEVKSKVKSAKYLIVSPVRDEQETIEKTIKSVIGQLTLPAEWVIVNDGSTDSTGEIVGKYLEKYKWIKIINLKDRGFRLPGKGIIEAFYFGLDNAQVKDWDYLVKLDGDLSFDRDYFSNIFNEFGQNPKLGIASGKTYLPINDDIKKLKLEWSPDTCTRGPSKIYKRECFEKIGGIRKERGWDTLDDIAAMVEGYDVKSFSQFKIIHYRAIGVRTKTDKGVRSQILAGQNFYYIGYHPIFIFLKSMKVMFTASPKIIGGIVLWASYMHSWLMKKSQIEDLRLIRKLREIQLKRIF